MKKRLPRGISNFKKLRDGGFFYIDKTLLVQELYTSGEVVMLPRPRRVW